MRRTIFALVRSLVIARLADLMRRITAIPALVTLRRTLRRIIRLLRRKRDAQVDRFGLRWRICLRLGLGLRMRLRLRRRRWTGSSTFHVIPIM